ncbi:MAG TPA: HisA/HisF-related TIM barrel protein [Ornithinimicrobium sp.]|uniref:1-(5-phosphoribosyl)-5-[(5- phosphoribosylamino)methylideneamino]imidazole-4- carboxamide isomerase n=1 Tax=Ornithinimicrobium sp. TaxID=1977084 RepID=UPI002B499F5C|nr:HisA/HisF-related TIM barrel protein [Ornithinimicrobium sp.]HKJ12054.1 HisA/HisF-related TIM barrel protein [Ornithinimicrobium sp.]
MPAVDVAGGRATQGPPGALDDPHAVAAGWVKGGASWMHLVDLDRAFRRGDNHALIRRLVTASTVPVQLSGGIDDAETASSALATPASRVNLASTAVTDLVLVESLVAAHGPRVVVGLDVQGDQVVARGSGVALGALEEVVSRVASTGAREFLVADARRDGTRAGVDVGVLTRAVERLRRHVPQARVVLSGGVSSLADLRALTPLEEQGVWAVVLGSALHHGRFTLADALRTVQGDV